MPDVFLSYSRDDQAVARRFATAFERAGFSVWWDQTLIAGEAFDEATERALEGAAAVVVLWSKKSVASRWVRAEATQANERGTLVPVMIEPCKRPIMFELTHTADLTQWKGDDNDPAWQSYLAGLRQTIQKTGGGLSASTSAGETGATRAAPVIAKPPVSKARMVGVPLVLLIVIGAALFWLLGPRSGESTSVATPVPPSTPATTDTSVASASAASIAVMAFENLTGQPDKEYFSDGMAEELINKLSKVQGLKVASRPASFAYKGKGADRRQVARDLQVKTIVEGSVQSAGETIRISVQLINTDSGYNLWTETYTRKYTDIFKLQDELAQEIVSALKWKLGADIKDYATRGPPTENLEAYSLFLQAQGPEMNRTEGDPRRIRLLQQAVAKDPKFAAGYADLAWERWLTGQPLADVERDARRAVELDPLLGAQSILGAVEAARRNWLAAAQYFNEATTVEYLGRVSMVLALLWPTGRIDAALELQLKSLESNPNGSGIAYALSRFNNAKGRNEEAIRYADRAEASGFGRNASRQLNTRADVAARKGQYAEAANYMLGGLSAPVRSAGGMETVSLVYAAMGEPAKRAAATESLRQLLEKVAPREDPAIRVWAMGWFVQIGALDQAYDVGNELQRLYEARTPAGAWGWLWHREMSAFRRDARFQDFVTRLGMMPYWEKYGPPDDCDLKDGKLSCR